MPSETASVSANVPKSVRDNFDEALDTGRDGSRSRSKQIEIAMRLWSSMGPQLEDAGWDIDNRRKIQGLGRQAVWNFIRDTE